MRILLLSQWFQPEPIFKGLPFAQALTERGHTVEVLTGFPNYPSGKLYPNYRIHLWQTEVLEGIRVHRTALYPSHDKSGLRRMLNYLSFALSVFCLGPWLVNKPQVIYVYNLVTLMPAAILMRALSGARIVLDVQDLWPESVVNSGLLRPAALMRILSVLCRWIYRQADWLTVLSPGFKEALAARGVPPEKIEVIYNWCDEVAQQPTTLDEELARNLGLVGKFPIIFAGTMGVMQGLDTVLQAASLCQTQAPGAQFVFIGGGVDRPRLEALAGELKLSNVSFVPPQLPQDMGRYFALAEALLVHLKDDALFRITIPSKTQAYLYMGKPIIMAVHGDAAALVERAQAGLICPPGNPAALTRTVAQLMTLSAAERGQMGRAGAAFYAQKLAIAIGVTHFEARFQALTGS